MSLIFVDCEAGGINGGSGISPFSGVLTEFGAVDFLTNETFYGKIWDCVPDPKNPAVSIPKKQVNDPTVVFNEFAEWIEKVSVGRAIFVSDNPAYDFQWINYGFDQAEMMNPFGHSGRRIGDFYSGLVGDWKASSKWKKFRVTKHTHHPVDDAMGNIEAFREILRQHPNVYDKPARNM